MNMDFKRIKEELGIEACSCLLCCHIYNPQEEVIREIDHNWCCGKKGRKFISNLKYFPFKTDQKCFSPCFWHTRFSKNYDGTKNSFDECFFEFMETIRALNFKFE